MSAKKAQQKLNYNSEQNEILVHQCEEFARRRLFFIAPALTGLAAIAWVGSQSWNFGVFFLLMIIIDFMFVLSYRLAVKEQISKSLWAALVPSLLGCMTIVVFFEGLSVVMVFTTMALIAQVAIFSRKLLLTGCFIAFVMLISDKLIDSYGLWTRVIVSPKAELLVTIVLGLVMAFFFFHYLVKHKEINDSVLLRELKNQGAQKRIINSFLSVMPSLEEAISDISDISNDVFRETRVHTSSMLEMSAVITEILSSSNQAVNSAKKTNQITESTYKSLNDNVGRFMVSENSLGLIMSQISTAKAAMQELFDKADRVENILAYNREIGENIKVLSVNASIEAAEAGEFGTGFGVVARELREMIDSTEGNLSDSRSILNDIRTRARSGMESIEQSATNLEKFKVEFASAKGVLEKNARDFDLTFKGINKILDFSGEQQSALSEVGNAIASMQSTSEQLIKVSDRLSSAFEQIKKSKQKLACII